MVRAKALPDSIDPRITCPTCTGPLPTREAQFALKYFLLRKALFADVRGSTQLATRLGPTEFAALMQRFFQTAIKVFTWTDAIVDKMVGDEVIGIYVPCLTGADVGPTVA